MYTERRETGVKLIIVIYTRDNARCLCAFKMKIRITIHCIIRRQRRWSARLGRVYHGTTTTTTNPSRFHSYSLCIMFKYCVLFFFFEHTSVFLLLYDIFSSKEIRELYEQNTKAVLLKNPFRAYTEYIIHHGIIGLFRASINYSVSCIMHNNVLDYTLSYLPTHSLYSAGFLVLNIGFNQYRVDLGNQFSKHPKIKVR